MSMHVCIGFNMTHTHTQEVLGKAKEGALSANGGQLMKALEHIHTYIHTHKHAYIHTHTHAQEVLDKAKEGALSANGGQLMEALKVVEAQVESLRVSPRKFNIHT